MYNLAWPNIGMRERVKARKEVTPTDGGTAPRDGHVGRITIPDPDVDLENGLVEGQEYDYRFWARWACR